MRTCSLQDLPQSTVLPLISVSAFQQKSSGVPPLLRAFMLSLCEDNSSRMSPVDILR